MNRAFVVVLVCAGLNAQSPEREWLLPAGFSASHSDVARHGEVVDVLLQGLAGAASSLFHQRSTDLGVTFGPWRAHPEAIPGGVADDFSCASSSAGLFLVWREAATGEIFFSRSTDGGLTWATQVSPLATGAHTRAHWVRSNIVASGSDVSVVWKAEGGTMVRSSADAGANWGQPISLGRNNSSQGPVLAASGRVLHVVQPQLGGLFVHSSTDGGVSWSSNLIHPFAAGRVNNVAMDVDGQSVFVTWNDFSNSRRGIRINHSHDGGLTWQSAASQIDDGTRDCLLPTVGVHQSRVHVAWLGSDTTTLQLGRFVRSSTDGGQTWSPAQTLHPNANSGQIASASVDVNAEVAVLVHHRPNALFPIFPEFEATYSTDGGATWRSSAPVFIGPFAAEVVLHLSGCSAAVTQSGRLSIGVPPQPIRTPNGTRSSLVFGNRRYGSGTAGAGGIVPTLRTSGCAIGGETLSAIVENAGGGYPAGLLIGFGATAQVSLPLLGGQILVLPDVSVGSTTSGMPTAPGLGAAVVPLALPSSMQGINVNMQAVILDPAAPGGLAMTDAVEVWIG